MFVLLLTAAVKDLDAMYDINWTPPFKLESRIVFLPQNPSDSDQDALSSLKAFTVGYMASGSIFMRSPVMPVLTSQQLESLPRGQPNMCPTVASRVPHQASMLYTDTVLSLRKTQMPV